MEPLIFLTNYENDYPKALQLYIDSNPHLVICPENRLHHQGLKQLLENESIPFETQSFGIDGFGPLQKGGRYELVGAGFAIITDEKIHLHYKSRGYKIGINREHAERINPLISDTEISFDIL